MTRLEVRGRQALAGGYERVFGVAHGVVAGGEPVRGLPAGGVRYDAEFELLRPRRPPVRPVRGCCWSRPRTAAARCCSAR